MTTQTPATAPASPPELPGRGRRGLLVAGAAALLVAALVALLLVLGNEDEQSPSSAATATSTPADATVPAPLPTPEPTGPTEDVDELPAALPEVALDEPAAVGNGIVARIAGLEAVDGTAVGPGNIAGPALRITVSIENGTEEPVSLGGVAVNASYGADRTPASPLEDEAQRAFTGLLEPGESADGVYVFSVPADARDRVTVEVGYQAGAPLLLFTGSAP
ncbi:MULTISPECIES: hypothetical protein [unclassified Geodermatophilus]|uniref:hypothetical protein n=1 Tax=unclassified Geodermatophilus TaxID=2637632 RepID=UPI003EEBF624